MRRLAAPALGLVIAGLASPCLSQEEEAGTSLELSAAYTGDLRRNTSGGLQVGTAYAHELDLGASWSTDRGFDGARVTGSVAVMYLGGDAISGDFVGDLQGINNLEARVVGLRFELAGEHSWQGK